MSSLSSPSSFSREFPSSFCKSREGRDISKVTTATWGQRVEPQSGMGSRGGGAAGSQCESWDQVTTPPLRVDTVESL